MTMLGTIKKNKKTTVLSGIGVALFLCLIMVLMPMSSYVQNNTEESGLVAAEPSENENDYFKLPETIQDLEYEYDADMELKGFRDANTKAFLTEDGEIVQLIANEPVHYMDSYGVWHDIDTNVKATANGYEVSENTFFTAFAPEAGGGVIVQPNEFVDPIVTGIAPMLITLDEAGIAPTPYDAGEATGGVTVSGNSIRYPIGQGFDLDYLVEQTQVKQILVVRERPDLLEGQEWFGLAEGLRLPAGYALFSGDVEIGTEVYQTQDALQVRNIETGELFVEIPVPTIIEPHSTEAYIATFFVQVHGNHVILQTMVEADWILSDDRVFPLGIDPTIQVSSAAGGYCYIYYVYCYSSTYRYHYRYYSTYYYVPWHKYTFTSSNALPSGATVSQIQWKKYMSYAYGSSVTFTVSVLEGCGLDARYNYAISTNSCNGNPLSASYLTSNYGGTASRSMVSSIGNSPSAGTVSSSGTGWKTVTFCNSASTCSATSGGVSHITSAQSNTATVGIGERYNSSSYVYTYAYASGSTNSYLAITYTGGTDADAPTADFPKYDGQASYVEGERTFFITLTDLSGIDTTSTNGVKLNYRKNNASSWTSTSATTIGTCSSTSNSCKFKATTADASYGDYMEYYWSYQDLNQGSNGPNSANTPSAGSSGAYDYWVIDPDNAPVGDTKLTVLTTDVHAGSYYTPQGFLDRQMTYYEGNAEYYFEFDVSNCGTGSQTCWYTSTASSNYFYNNWYVRWNTVPYSSSSSTGYGTGGSWGTTGARGTTALHSYDGGYLPGLNAVNGPGMNIMMVYDSTANDWAMVGIGTSPDIDQKLSGGSSATYSYGYGYSAGYRIMIPGDITGDFATWEFNASGGSGQANQLCVGTNGFYYFVRYTGSGAGTRCTPAYYYIYNNPASSSTYRWSGFALAAGYYGRMASTGDITYKVSSIKPLPDQTAPEMDHTPMANSHAKDRRVSVTISDGGDPPSGVNTTATTGVGPTLYYRITNSSGTGSWTSKLLSPPSGQSRTTCASASCTWSADIEDLEVNDEVEYKFSSQDTSTASTGINYNNSSTYSFSRGDPSKMFIVEWRDIGYYTYDQCTVQAVFYDVTNEIEFKYNNGCRATYNSWSIGYMNQARNKGADISSSSSTSYANPGHIPTTSNYRIHTNSTSHGWEEFDKGLVEIVNYDTALQGSSNGFPYSYYCFYYWSSYSSYCNKNFDMPNGFEFDYFGTTYDGNNTNHRVNVARQGHMWFATSGTSALRSQWTWHYPSWPYSGSTYARPGLISPWSSIYSSYYCFQTSSLDCGVYYRVMPYEGKGTDIYANTITTDPQWDITDSPVRLHPTSDYVSISSDFTINPGVVVQVDSGKGISIDGQCSKVKFIGNSSNHIRFEGLGGAEWKGLSFTDDCSSTDDRHQFSFVDIANTSSAAISAGSRHGDHSVTCIDTSTGSSRSCYTNNNAGNFTLSDVTFSNVETAISHGSGGGTGVYMTDFSIDGADKACLDFPEDANVVLMEGTLEDCNTDGIASGGAIVNYPGSTSGSLHAENLTVTNSYVNFIDVDLKEITLSNITVTNPSAQTGAAIDSMHGANSDVYIFNVDADSYASSQIQAMGSLKMIDVDLGSADLSVIPGGSSQTGNGPSGDNMVFDGITTDKITLRRVHPGVFDDVTGGDVDWAANDITGKPVKITNTDIDAFNLQGGGWNIIFEAVSAASIKSSASSGSRNTFVVDGGTFAHSSSSQSVFDGRYTDFSVGEVSISSTTVSSSGPYVVEARTGTDFVLVEASLNSNDCSDSSGATGNCPVSISGSSSNPSQIYYGGLAWIRAYKIVSSSESNKSGHTVSATLVDGNNNEMSVNLYQKVTDTNNGSAQVWVITEDGDGTPYTKHNLRASGPAGINETFVGDSWYSATTNSGSFGVGDSAALRLYPAPLTFEDPTLDCASLASNVTLAPNYDSNTNTFRFQETTISVLDSFEIDGCTIVIEGGVLRVTSTSTTQPVITISQGGELRLTDSPDITGLDGTIVRASSSANPLRFDLQGGTINVMNGSQIKDLYQDGTTDSALLVGDGSTLKMSNSATIFGAQASSDDMATVKVNGGTIDIDSSTIQNTGQTGTALWVEASGGSIDNIVVKNAAVGIQSYNGAPQVDGFTLSDNDVGIGVYGGMSLPTVYRSTLLSGQNAGWKTYAIDASTFLGGGNNYLQIGANAIYGGGDAHPYYSYTTSKYYLIFDRLNIELTDNAGNKWNVTNPSHLGYYPYSSSDPAISTYSHVGNYDGGNGGAPSWHCNYYGYNYGPNYNYYDGYFYYMYYYWLGQGVSYPGYYEAPNQFGFDWENIPGVTPTGTYSYYPYMWWGYYSPSFMFSGVNTPPEGSNGQGSWPGNVGNPPSYAANGYPTNYGLCMAYAYTYYMSSGQGARMTFPVVDISASNLSKVTIYMDFLHDGADNYQDRMDFVARASSSASDLVDEAYVRESGTPMFKNGEITGADNGIDIGGNFAAADFLNIDVTSPTNAGLIVTGQSTGSAESLNVTNGDYGVLVSTSGSGSLDLKNLDLDGQAKAGVYYAKDISGELTGSFTNIAGPAIEYGASTSADVEFSDLTITSNDVGIETAGSGKITLKDSTFSNTNNDFVISGSSVIDFIEGDLGLSTVDVTGSGKLNRMRIANITVTADSSFVTGTSVVVRDGDGNIQGVETTDSNGKASGITFITDVVSSTGTVTPSLNGYTASTVAQVEYTSSTADFRYTKETLSLVDDSYNNEESVDLVNQFDTRICYNSQSSSYIQVASCRSYISSYGSTTYSSPSGFKEWSYYRSHDGSDLAGKTVMMDTPYWYLEGGEHDWNGTDFIFTASYAGNMANYMYPYYYYGEIDVYMNDASVTAAAVSDEGELNGASLGYMYYAWNFQANNTTFDGIQSLSSGVGYGYYTDYMPDFFDVTNSTITHYKGYTPLNNAIQNSDMCIILNGVEGTDINDNTFNNCGVGVFSQRSGYYYTHTSSEIGSDNLTVNRNTFNDGGEIADIWLYNTNEIQGAEIDNNVFHTSAGGSAVAIYPGNTKDVDITNNEIYGGDEDLLFIYQTHNFNISGNDITGVTQQADTTGIYTYQGSGSITDNTITDTEYSGIYMEQITTPPASGNSLCSIGRTDYRYSDTCDWTLGSGKKATLDLDTDSWGYEISIAVVLNNTTTVNSWSTYTFNSNAGYHPLATYTTPGYYKLYVNDSYGDGGATIEVTETSTGSTTSSDAVVSGNTIGLSVGRTSPSAVGVTYADCDAIGISSSSNTVTLEDNAMVIDDCDVSDVGSTFTGVGASGTTGVFSDSAFNGLTLNGTTISGYDIGVYKELGVLSLLGDADITGDAYGIFADDVEVYSLGASVAADTTDGVGLYLLNSDDSWIYPLDVEGDVGVFANNSVFRWDNLGTGVSDATTALKTEDSTGSIENMTFGSSTTYQIDAGSNSQVTSIGHTLNPSELLVDSTAVIDEANLFNIETTHLGAAPANDVALMIMSSDNSRASYVSTSFQPEVMNIDGSTDDWFGGNELNPAGYAMPGNMSGDGTDNMYITYNVADSLYVGLTGVDLTNGDVLIYLSVDGSGSSTGYNGMGGSHDLPFSANYLLWADSTSSYDLYSYGFLGWGPSSLSTESISLAQGTDVLEFEIPFSRIGGTPDAVDIITLVQEETTATVTTVHPTQTIDSMQVAQSFEKYVSLELKHGDLNSGSLYDEVLVYRSYKGTTTPSGATDYNVMVMTNADCEIDWTVVPDVSLANNVYMTSSGTGVVDIARACPVIQSTLTDISILEDYDNDADGSIDTYSFSLTDLADDVQDEESTLTWQVIDANLDAYDNILLGYSLTGQTFSIVPVEDAFGTIEFTFNVTDSNGLMDEKTIVFTIENVNDAPVICNVNDIDCTPIFSSDDGFENILPEGFGTHKKYLGALANQTQSYIRDKANEQVPYRQSYSWAASVPSTCTAFEVEIDGYELVITENTSNELGGACDVTLVVTDNGSENQDSAPYDVTFSVSPVNDAPIILDWDRQNEVVMQANNGSIPNVPWMLTLMEDDTNLDNLTYDLSAIKYDIDHELDDLYWTVEATDQCEYQNYFTTTITGDDLIFELVPDATTNARIWEIDYLNDNGIHQIPPIGSEFCQIRLVLRDTLNAPSYVPNYDTSIMPIANYQQGMVTKEIGVRVDNVRELVPDYYFDDSSKFSWNGVTSLMTGSYLPVTVKVGGGGDEGPYTYDHMLKVTFHTDGHAQPEIARYYTVPDYGGEISITDNVYITRDTTEVWVEMDVLTCLTNPCDLTTTVTQRFQIDQPGSHRATNSGLQGDMWSKPGQYGSNGTTTSQRRPLLEDSNWCNNVMSSSATADICNHANQPADEFIATNQSLPIIVGQIGASAVPSFAPSMMAVALAGLFVTALSFTSRRDEDEEEVRKQTMADDEGAVSPVIATILMVAITVVLSGVIYVWASSLADTDVKGTPRVTFKIEEYDATNAETGHWRITIGQSETDLATQAVQVRIIYTNATGATVTKTFSLSDSNGVYGYNPENSDAFVMFVDSTLRKEGTNYKSTFSAGDTIFVRTHDPEGTPLEKATVSITYAPAIAGQSTTVLKTYEDLSYNKAP